MQSTLYPHFLRCPLLLCIYTANVFSQLFIFLKGVGKTTLVNSIMTVCKNDGITFFNVSCAEIYNPYLGQSVKIVKEIFKEAHKCAPAVIHFDEIDSLLKTRKGEDSNAMSGIKSQFLVEMQTDFCGVITIGSTNHVELMDPAFVRRLENRMVLTLPGPIEKLQMLSNILEG